MIQFIWSLNGNEYTPSVEVTSNSEQVTTNSEILYT